MTQRIALLLLAAAGLLWSGLAAAQRPALDAEEARQAAADYQRYCALCHGADREGHANDHAPSLRSKSLIESGFPMVMFEAIAYGRPGTPMGGYYEEIGGPLSRGEISRLTAWLRDASGVHVEQWDYERGFERLGGDIARGAVLYAQHCAECHGGKGEGGTGTALANATMLALTPDHFLRHAIVHGRQDTPMQAYAGVLSEAEIDGVTAYLRSRGGGEAVTSRPLQRPPGLDEYVINPGAAAPDFGALREGRYVDAATLDRELKARRRMVLLDTRVASMWQMAHIEGAVPLPYYSNREQVLAGLPRDGTWIVAYCECPRAAADSVVRRLREAGFANTAVLWEGIQGWVSLGYPVVAGDVSER